MYDIIQLCKQTSYKSDIQKHLDAIDLELHDQSNLTKVIPLFSLLHRGNDNSPLLIVFGAYYVRL